MERVGRVAGAAAIVLGVLIALAPFFSVSGAGVEMLAETPVIDGVDHLDDRGGWTAMFDDGFVLAQRTYAGIDEQTVKKALERAGFEPVGSGQLSKECCGSYDAAWADVRAIDDGRVLVELTAADADWQQTWPIVAGFGGLVALIGIAILRSANANRIGRAHDRRATRPDARV